MIVEWIFRNITISKINFPKKKKKIKHRHTFYKKWINFVFKQTINFIKNKDKIFQIKKNLFFLFKKKFKISRSYIKDISIKKLKCQNNIIQTFLNKKLIYYYKFNANKHKSINKNLQFISFEYLCLKNLIIFVIINLKKSNIIKILKYIIKRLNMKN
nr:hypothetical protein CcurKRNrm3_p160 [Cryptomonas curvata]